MRTLIKPNNGTPLELLTEEIQILPSSRGVYFKITGYNLTDLMAQLLEEWGDEKILQKIKDLEL